MPSREPELYKDKIEVSLDGRQIFYLFFGGAVIVGLVFVLGVLVGRRVEARGHLDRAETQAETDPLAALDRLERSDRLSFHGALRGSEAATDVEKAIGEIEKRRVQADKKPEKKPEEKKAEDKKVEDKKPEADKRLEADKKAEEKRAEDKKAEDKKAEDKKAEDKKAEDKKADEKRADADKKLEADKHPEAVKKPEAEKRAEMDKKAGEPVTRPEADKPRSEKKGEGGASGEKKPRKHDDAVGEARPARRDGDKEAHAEPRSDGEARSSSENKQRFTLQLSSFQDKSEAEAFLSATKSAGYQPYLVEADVSGKGTFYRVRLGSYRSIDAANDAKVEYEKAAKKTAQVMRL